LRSWADAPGEDHKGPRGDTTVLGRNGRSDPGASRTGLTTAAATSNDINIVNDNNSLHTDPAQAAAGPDLILHPVRMRIILALAGGGSATTAELADRLPGIAPATLYRHLDALRRGGILAVAEERRVRGATERRFVLHPGAASLGPADFAAATPHDHLRWFAMFLASLLGAFGRYVRSGQPDLARDGVGYREVVLHLSDAELMEMGMAINGALLPFLAQPAAPGRVPRLLATILVPAEPSAGTDSPPTAQEAAP
jgi:DNA-binding transcriptional ArsR family regulator